MMRGRRNRRAKEGVNINKIHDTHAWNCHDEIVMFNLIHTNK
jgi:hypothetical protein